MKGTVQFSESPTPAFQAGVWILQLIAEALRGVLSSNDKRLAQECANAGLSSIDIPRILGGFAAQRLPSIGSDSKRTIDKQKEEVLESIWDDFLRENRIKKLPRPTLILFEKQAKHTIQTMRHTEFNFAYLERANQDAHAFVVSLLKAHGLQDLLTGGPTNVNVVEDLDLRMYCAGLRPGGGTILWAHQNVPHALTAMVLAERVLAHEYLSHRAPRNSSLGLAVSERWLVALLQNVYLSSATEPYWWNVLWPIFRNDLEDHIARIESAKNPSLEMVRTSGYAGVEAAASSLQDNAPDSYWRFTADILRTSPDDNMETTLSIWLSSAQNKPRTFYPVNIIL